MKRIFFALLLLASPAIADTVYSAADAGKHIGETAMVRGRASVYVSRSGVTFVDLDGRGRSAPFTGVIFKDKADAVPNVMQYNGKYISISGLIKNYQGKPEIIINDKSQLAERVEAIFTPR